MENERKLIDKIMSDLTLTQVTDIVRGNKGAAGVETGEILDYMQGHTKELRKQVVAMEYRPQTVRRVYIPKPNGKQRPLGIPVVIDRVLLEAAAIEIAPIFEAEFSESSYGAGTERAGRCSASAGIYNR